MKKFQLLKWTAEVSEKELQHLESEEYEYLNICYPEEE